MKYRKIWKRNIKQKLGRFNKQLVIRVVNGGRLLKKNHYHIVLARRRSRQGCRYDKLGFFELGQRKHRPWNFLGLNLKKIRYALMCGAIFNPSVYKILL